MGCESPSEPHLPNPQEHLLDNAQTVKAPPAMLIKRIQLYTLLVTLAQSNNHVYGFNSTSCSAEIQVKRLTQYTTHIGGSLTMECPVLYCRTKPSIQWCKMEEAKCVLLEEGRREWKSDSVFALEISPVHQNHSGHFRCQGTEGNLSIESHKIKVIVEEKPVNIATVSPESTTNISAESQKSENYKILLITSAPVGLCCLFTIGCTFWCLRRRHAKQKRTPLTQQREEILVGSAAAAAGTTQASQESSSPYSSIASPPHALKDNIIYDNHVPPWNALRTAPRTSPSIPVLPESPDGLTYAELNHSASAGRRQRRQPIVVNEITEYACINVHQ
ncbi:B and T lymphocyte associated [Willisornis vidua]|uniref:B and T lymphocyte associated n=1 Tax=Willisornis vidua TaxID=1566151 RepID=A0ABQ9CYU7_9PASS|nr:B and T lymphocyte associated [Willisornis vidua]